MHDLPTSVNDRVISLFRKNSEFTVAWLYSSNLYIGNCGFSQDCNPHRTGLGRSISYLFCIHTKHTVELHRKKNRKSENKQEMPQSETTQNTLRRTTEQKQPHDSKKTMQQSLFPSKMIAKLEKTSTSTPQNKESTQNHHTIGTTTMNEQQ